MQDEHKTVRTTGIEVHSVDFIPPNKRYGSPRNLFPLWFGACAMGVTLLTGSLAVFSGLSLMWTAVAIAIGTLVGAVFVAYHSAQGPKLGLPQMIQSRAQFGFYGANVPLVITIAMYLGFYGGGAILIGSIFVDLFGIPIEWGILIGGFLSVVLVTFGYGLLHAVAKVIAPLFIVMFGALTIVLIVNWPGVSPGVVTADNGFSLVGFFFVLGIMAVYIITFGPYVADYSRYLPEDTKASTTFWYSYGGMALAGVWVFTLGAAIQYAYSSLGIIDAVGAVAETVGPLFKIAIYIVLLIGLINVGAFNLYGAAMSAMTIGTSLKPDLKPTRRLRLWYMVTIGVIGAIGAVALSADLISAYQNFILFLVGFLIPWSSINLVDFYIARRGKYVIKDMFSPKGIYGSWSWIGLTSYIIGCLSLVPFISTEFYTGPLAEALGFDVSWIVGLIIPGVVYALLWKMHSKRLQESSNVPEEEAELLPN